MHLLSLNLQKPSAIITAIHGNFSCRNNEEIVIARGSTLELLRPDEYGKLISICETPLFAVIKSLLTYRIQGVNKDYVVVGSDSGKITIIEYDMEINDWKTVQCKGIGKTGCRRYAPGQYLAADPMGRALMIASIEKQRFVCITTPDSANGLSISSPLEAHRAETIVFSICGVDVGLSNPMFAMIELEQREVVNGQSREAEVKAVKSLTYYELDLDNSQVVRKCSEPISRAANMLLTVPGGVDGPSGVLMCGENWVAYRNRGHPEVRTALPRRSDMPVQKGLLITSAAMHKQNGDFFFMLQSELGDLYMVNLAWNPTDKTVTDVVVKVFDTLPPAVSLCITNTAMLFSASEFGNHLLLRFQNLGEDEATVVAHSVDKKMNEELGHDSISACRVAVSFTASPVLKNLSITDEIESMAPVTDMMVDDLSGEGTPQIYSLCGKGNRSSLRVLRHGISVTEMALSDLPGRPSAVWTVRSQQNSEYDKYIIVSFSNSTLVLSIGDTIEEFTDSGFLASVPTLDVVLLADNALLQVHPTGIRHIRPDMNGNGDHRISDWKTPGKKQIEKASANSRQVVVSLAGGELIYFEIDQAGQLVEMKTHDLGHEVACLDIGEVPPGMLRSPFLAVGSWDNTVLILSLEPDDLLVMRSTLSLSKRPESVCLVHMECESGAITPEAESSSSSLTMYLHVGLVSGMLCRYSVDRTAGTISNSRQRVLGVKPVKLFRVMVRGRRGILALSTRSWLLCNYQGRYFQAPISYETLDFASNFASKVCPEGVVVIVSNTLRIVAIDNLGAMFNQTVHPLRHTPRKMIRLPDTTYVAVIETDHNEYGEDEKEKAAKVTTKLLGTSSSESKLQNGINESEVMDVSNGCMETEESKEKTERESDLKNGIPIRGLVPPTDGHWASCVRIMDPVSNSTLELLQLTDNEAAFSICTCVFSHVSEERFIVVGTAKDMTLHPRSVACGYVHVYRFRENRLQLLHKTCLEEVPMAMCEFQGKLLVGAGKSMRLFELGKKKLLKKCENKGFSSGIVKLLVNGDRIYANDLSESVHFVKYRKQDNSLIIFANECSPRFMTSSCILDYDTVAGADKFGNVWVLQLPYKTNDNIDNPVGSRLLWDQGLLNGAPTKAQILTHFHVGEMVTAMVKSSLVSGGDQAIIAATVMGGIYAFVPFRRTDDLDLFQHLELCLRQECPSLVRRDHCSYRSYFQPVKDTVDGDLCEQYARMPASKQEEIADSLNRTPTEIMKKLEETRNSLL